MKKEEQLLLTLSRIDEYLGRVDSKANFWMSFDIFIIGGVLLSKDTLINKEICNIYCKYFLTGLWGFSLATAFASLLFSFIATKAFLKSGNTCEERSGEYITLFFFGSIAKLSRTEYLQRVRDSSSKSLKKDLLNQVHVLSRGLEEKFKWINLSKDFSAVSLFTVFLLIIQRIVIYK